MPPLEPPKWHFFGRSRGHGAHDNVGTWPRAREKRGTKRTTRDREEQLEVRGAFCFPFLARARAYSVGTGAPACTDRPPPGGVPPLPRPPTLAPVMLQGPPLCWERLRQGCTKLENAAHAVIFERMASDGKKINLDHIRRLRACLGGTRPGGGLRPRPPGSPGILCCPETPKTLFFHKKTKGRLARQSTFFRGR